MFRSRHETGASPMEIDDEHPSQSELLWPSGAASMTPTRSHSTPCATNDHFSPKSTLSRPKQDKSKRSTHSSSSSNESDASVASSVRSRRRRRRTSASGSHHLYLPQIISSYLQLFLNAIFVGVILYVLYSLLVTINHDIELKVDHYRGEALQEIALCARKYTENLCEPSTRLPAMQALCAEWETCMTRDAFQVGRARISAETFAGILNSFVEPITYKTMVFLTLLFVCLLLVNIALRSRFPIPHRSSLLSSSAQSDPSFHHVPISLQMGRLDYSKKRR